MYKVYSSCGFQQGDNIGITSSTCRHYTLSNSIMCSDSYPIPILSLFFLYHPYIPYFLIQRIFHFLVSFLFLPHACMYSNYIMSNTNGGLAPKRGLVLAYEQALSRYFPVADPAGGGGVEGVATPCFRIFSLS